MNKVVLGLAGILVIILVVAGLFLYTKKSNNQPNNVSPTVESTSTPSPTQNTQISSPSASPETATNEKTVNVTVTDKGYSPQTITINKGTKVIWTNNSSSSVTVNSDPHPIHTDYPPLNLNSFSVGSSVNLIFNTPGTYGYHNHLNPSQKGTVIVK